MSGPEDSTAGDSPAPGGWRRGRDPREADDTPRPQEDFRRDEFRREERRSDGPRRFGPGPGRFDDRRSEPGRFGPRSPRPPGGPGGSIRPEYLPPGATQPARAPIPEEGTRPGSGERWARPESAPEPLREQRSEATSRETAICGYNAVSAVFKHRKLAVKRLYFTEGMAPRTGDWCRAMAADRLIYRQVPGEDLARIADTVHHGGVVAVIEDPRVRSVGDAEVAQWSAAGQAMAVMDGIGNPHNIGFLARTAAFFGFRRLIVGARGLESPLAYVPASAYRVSEGGLETVEVRFVPVVAEFIKRNRAGFTWYGTDVREEATPLDRVDVQRLRRPPAIVFGNEEHGVSEDALRACEHRLSIRGTGEVESLNVSAAAAVILHHFAPAVKRLGG